MPAPREQITILSFEIDDMTGEEIAVAADRLRAVEGVLDLTIGQVQGKKGRLMQSFRLLVRPDRADAVIERCFLETSTIGLRVAEEQRVVLPRRLARAEADGIEIGIKTVERVRRHHDQGGERRSVGRQPRGAPALEAAGRGGRPSDEHRPRRPSRPPRPSGDRRQWRRRQHDVSRFCPPAVAKAGAWARSR